MENMSQKREREDGIITGIRPATPIPQSPDYPPPKRRKTYIQFPEMPDLEKPVLRERERWTGRESKISLDFSKINL